MDYKYIEQLLERYWNCETSLEEEQILRSFFHQKEIPAHLLRYKAMFAYQEIEKERGLGSDFDAKVLARVEKPVVKAQRLTLRTRFMPLFKAAAMIAVLFVMGTVVQRSIQDDGSDMVYMHDDYRDTVNDPQVAYEHNSRDEDVEKQGQQKIRHDRKFRGVKPYTGHDRQGGRFRCPNIDHRT